MKPIGLFQYSQSYIFNHPLNMIENKTFMQGLEGWLSS